MRKTQVIKFPGKKQMTKQPKWSREDAVDHLARFVSDMLNKHNDSNWSWPEKLHKEDLENLQHSVDIVDGYIKN